MKPYSVEINAYGTECGADIKVKALFQMVLAATPTSALNKSKKIFKSRFKEYVIEDTYSYEEDLEESD